MPLPLFDLAELAPLTDIKVKPPKIVLPDLDRLIVPELPAISFELAPALEDLAALTDGIPADLQRQLETLLAAQVGSAFPGAAVVSVSTGEKPDYALLLTPDPAKLPASERARLVEESLKLTQRRQKFGIYLEPEAKGGNERRKKGTAKADEISDISPILGKTGAPFAIRVETAALVKAANRLIVNEAPRYSLEGNACGCGPVSISSIAITAKENGKVETVVTGKVGLLLDAVHSGFELHIVETLAVSDNGAAPGSLADPKVTVSVEVLQIVGAGLPEKVKKLLERDVVKWVITEVFPIGTLLAMALRAMVSLFATKRAEEGDAVRGPIHDALELALAPQMIRGTDQKVLFDLGRAATPAGDIKLTGVVLVTERRLALRMRTSAKARRVEGDVFDVTFRAIPTDMVDPVIYTWACLGEEKTGGAEITFAIDLAAHPEFPVEVSSVDADGQPAPMVRYLFKKVPLGFGVMIIGERVRR